MDYDEAFWEARYSSADAIWSGNVNPQLVDEVTGLTPGSALDVGCGEGADALWLARQGWRTTGVDLSRTALARAAAQAAAAGLAVGWVQGDVSTWEPPASYDLVCAFFLHLPEGPREPALQRLAAAVNRGGTFLVVQHFPPAATPEHAPPPEFFATPEQLAALLDPADWDLLTAEKRRRPGAVEGVDMHTDDAVVRAVRR